MENVIKFCYEESMQQQPNVVLSAQFTLFTRIICLHGHIPGTCN